MTRFVLAAIAALTIATPALAGTCTQPGDTGALMRAADGTLYYKGHAAPNKRIIVFADEHTARSASRAILEATGYPKSRIFAIRGADGMTGYMIPVAQGAACGLPVTSTNGS